MEAALAIDEADSPLICEGFLLKRRGYFQTRRRWFRLTSTTLAFHEKEGGKSIAITLRSNIMQVVDLGPKSLQFTVDTIKPFGASGQRTMLLESPSLEVKTKWLVALRAKADAHIPDAPLAEGPLTRLRPTSGLGASAALMFDENKQRWFVLTRMSLSYFDRESHARLNSQALEHVDSVFPRGDDRMVLHFDVKSAQPEMVLQCSDSDVQRKWLTSFRVVLGDRAKLSEYGALPKAPRASYGAAIVYDPDSRTTEDDSEGNRFIQDREL